MQQTMPTRWLEDFTPGTAFSGGPRRIAERDLLFCTLWCGDGQPHSNEEYSRKSPWGGRILHGDGMLALGLGLIQRQGMFRDSLLGCNAMTIAYPRPVYVGDEIGARMEVISAQATSADGGVLEVNLAVVNETRTTTAIEATIHYRIKRRP